MKKSLILAAALCATLSLLAFGMQQHDKNSLVQGQVIDKLTGEPLAGACITAGSQAVYTDFDGNFTLSQAAGSTLSVSLISYEAQQVKAAGSTLVVALLQ
ncbi:MAG: carboxypeptidase-like regulatory domain-containing protein [Prevotellaceae bacterium]|jgi:hypothetical protein|nr:carboxypeptidase-like regulatory domain-containing protein [Prevotellaceae bacterium]